MLKTQPEPEFPKYRRIPYFSTKVHFYAKQTTQLPSDISETLKHRNISKTPKLKTEPDTHQTYTPQPSKRIPTIKHITPQPSRRYKYPTINADTYTLNEDYRLFGKG